MDKKTKIGVIGLGERGYVLAQILLSLPQAQLAAISDLYPERMQCLCDIAAEKQQPCPKTYADYHDLLADSEVQGVIIATPILQHVSIAIEAMRTKKYVAVEAGAACSEEECWQLVHTAEQYGVDCMLLENCCYGRRELALLQMIRQNVFGEMVYFEGGYQHDLREEIVKGFMKNKQTRIHNYLCREGDSYPCHGLGPIAKFLNMNYGNRMVSLTSSATKAVGLKDWISKNLETESYLSDARFTTGDIVTTMIKWANGEMCLLTFDTTLPRPYSRGGLVQGTKGIWVECSDQMTADGKPLEDMFGNPGAIHLEHVTPNLCTDGIETMETGLDTRWESFAPYLKEHEHPLWIEMIDSGVMSQFHPDSCVNDGMDLLVVEAFVQSVSEQSVCPLDVYDCASILCVSALSEKSVKLGGASVAVPDFTSGKWIERTPAKGKYML